MQLLSRYIARAIFSAVLIVLLVIVALDALALLVDQLGDLSEQYTFIDVLIYSALSLPASLYEFMPFAALVGSLVGLGALATTSELVILRAAGVSLARISWAVMQPVLVFIIATLLLGEYVIPLTNQLAESRRALLLGDNKQSSGTHHGLWNREGNEFVHFNAVSPNGTLHGVTRYQFDNNGELVSSSFAEKAIYRETSTTIASTSIDVAPTQAAHVEAGSLDNLAATGFWQEENIVETLLPSVRANTTTAIAAPASIRRHVSRVWHTQLSPPLLNVLVLEPDTLAIGNLYAYTQYLEQQNIDSGRYRLSFWSKLLQPVATLSLVLIAISFIFGPLREVTMGYRVFTGVIVGVVFQMSQNLLGPASLVYGFPPLVAVLLPITACLLLGIFLLQRVR